MREVQDDGTDRSVGIHPRLVDAEQAAPLALRQRLVDAFCAGHRAAPDHPNSGACELGSRMVDTAITALAAFLRDIADARGDDTLHRLADEVTR